MKKIPVSNGKYFALIDDEDFPIVSQYKWCAHVQGDRVYARCRSKSNLPTKDFAMHRIITRAKKNIIVDHVNGDCLDNRRQNLRFCINAENSRNRRRHKNNSSGYKGVYYRSGRKKPWIAKIGYQGKNIHIGGFSTPEDAAYAYNELAFQLFGEFAKLNVVGTV